jgi:alpha-1,6-mannosyltransferase
MKICDITQFYNSSSGGIRTYIDMKRKYIKEETDWEHLLIIPGEEDSIYCQPKASTLQIAAPLVPAGTHYRFIVRLDKVISILKVERPDIIELGCPYILPWAAFFYRGRFHCAVIGCYHTDFPTAYVEPIIAKIMGNDWAQKAKHLASLYLRLVYNKCDMTFTSSKIFQKNSLN